VTKKFIENFRMDCIEILNLMELIAGEKSFLIPDEKLEELTNDWLDYKEEISDNYSYRYITEKLSKFLQDLKVKKEKDKAPIIDAFFKEFNRELCQNKLTYVCPQFIENLKIDEAFAVGKIEFIPYSEKNYIGIFQKPGYTTEHINLNKKVLEKVYCIAKSEVIAGDFYKALEKSDKLIDESLNVIRLFESYPNYGILGKYRQPRLHKVYYSIKETKQVGYSGGWNFLTRPGYLTSKVLKTIKMEKAFVNINAIHLKNLSERTDMENKLILSINWFGEILKNKDTIENIIRLFTAFEILLIFDRNEEKKKNIAQRLAMINYSDKKYRILTYNLVENLYSIRSKLVHEGKTILKEKSFFDLLRELHSCIIIIATHIDKYPTIEAWNNLIKSVQFEGKLEFQ